MLTPENVCGVPGLPQKPGTTFQAGGLAFSCLMVRPGRTVLRDEVEEVGRARSWWQQRALSASRIVFRGEMGSKDFLAQD